jgi:hypothetical protein
MYHSYNGGWSALIMTAELSGGVPSVWRYTIMMAIYLYTCPLMVYYLSTSMGLTLTIVSVMDVMGSRGLSFG